MTVETTIGIRPTSFGDCAREGCLRDAEVAITSERPGYVLVLSRLCLPCLEELGSE